MSIYIVSALAVLLAGLFIYAAWNMVRNDAATQFIKNEERNIK
jgi:hypothetical protein